MMVVIQIEDDSVYFTHITCMRTVKAVIRVCNSSLKKHRKLQQVYIHTQFCSLFYLIYSVPDSTFKKTSRNLKGRNAYYTTVQ